MNRRQQTWSRRGFLGACLGTVGALSLLGRAAQAQAQGKRLLLIFVPGGWDVTWALDPKPDNPNVDMPPGEVRLYGDLPILAHEDRPSIHQLFADFGDRAAVVNGVEVGSIAHPECTRLILTGTHRETSPDVGIIAGHALGAALPVPYFVLGNATFTGPLAASSGRAGATNQIVDLLQDRSALLPQGAVSHRYRPEAQEEALVRSFLTQSAELDQQRRGQAPRSAARLQDYLRSQERAARLRGFADGFGERGFQVDLEQQLDLAVELLREGICQATSVTAAGPWDTHVDNALQGPLQDALCGSLHRLAVKMERQGLLKDTLVLVLSEMSRTPKLNAEQGKDHWSVTSALLLGGGVAGGRAHGATTEKAEAAPVDRATGLPSAQATSLRTEDLLAGTLELLGVDSAPWFPNSHPLLSLKP